MRRAARRSLARHRAAPLGLVVLAGAVACASGPRGLASRAAASPPSAPASSAHAPEEGSPAAAATEVDAHLEAVWRAAGIAPAPPADDATWLRRATLDLTGTVPTPDEVRAFLADARPGKRGALVARLVRTEAFADHFAAYWDDVLLGPSVRSPHVDRVAFRVFLRDAFRANRPWGAVVRELVAGVGTNSAGGAPRGAAALAAAIAPDGRGGDDDLRASGADADDAEPSPGTPPAVNGALGFLLKHEASPEDLAGTAARTFLGTQIQCAQCHDHKTEPWKTADFRAFAAPFAHLRVRPLEPRKGPGVRRVAVDDAPRAAPRLTKTPERRAIAETPPRALDGSALPPGAGARGALAAWMTSPDNPLFARAFVNRVWSQLLGRGFVNPVDDLRPSNPPVAPAAEATLARGFAAHGHDVRWLVEAVASTRAYGLASGAAPAGPAPSASAPDGAAPFARFELTPLGPEELVNALFTAAGDTSVLGARPDAQKAKMRRALAQRYAFLFDVDEENAREDYAGTLGQALALSNGELVAAVVGVAARSEAARRLRAGPGGGPPAGADDDALFEELWLRLLGRPPAPDELARARATLAAAPRGAPRERLRAFEDVAWSLALSSEFFFNH